MNLEEIFDEALDAHRAGDAERAKALYEQVLEKDPEHAGAWLNLGAVFRKDGQIDRALEALRRADRLAPDHPGVRFNLGNALADDGALDDAAMAFRDVIRLDPGFIDAFNNLGDVLTRSGNITAAIEVFTQGLAGAPEHPGLRANLGNALLKAGDSTGARSHLEHAHRLVPDDLLISRNLANAYRTAGRLEDAEHLLRQVLLKAPDDAEAHCLMAFTLLANGDFGSGWDAYAWRWRSAEHEPARPFSAPVWRGEKLNGKSILVWGEQAVGDELMFATILGDLRDTGALVTVETEYRLRPLLARSFPDFQIVARRSPPAQSLLAQTFNFQTAAGDLARQFRRREADFSANEAYLVSDPAKTSVFRERYGTLAGGRKRIGISWRSGQEQAGVRRSISAEEILPVLKREDCWFVNLQYGDTSDDEATFDANGAALFSDPDVDPLSDLDSAVAQIASLDALISIANTTVHLAGAIGVRTCALLSTTPDWRWQRRGTRTPWYPSVELVRQVTEGDWTEPISRAVDFLDGAP